MQPTQTLFCPLYASPSFHEQNPKLASQLQPFPSPPPKTDLSPSKRVQASVRAVREDNRFATHFEFVFVAPGTVPFDCSVCGGPSSLMLSDDFDFTFACSHYISCTECCSRSIPQLLRCVACCSSLFGRFPGCGTECVEY